MADLEKIRAELDKGTYVGLTAEEKAAALNAPSIIIQGYASNSDVLVWGGSTGAIDLIDDGAALPANLAGEPPVDVNRPLRAICKTAQKVFSNGATHFNTSGDENLAMLDALVTYLPGFTQGMSDALIALGARSISIAERDGMLGHSKEIGPAHVLAAEAL